MKKFLFGALLGLLPSAAMASCPTTITDCPSPTYNVVTPNQVIGGTFVSPNLTGTPVAPTATVGTNTSQIATTAFTTAAISAASGAVTSVVGQTGAVTASQIATATQGTSSTTLAAGNDSRITGALQTSSAGPLATQAGANSAAAIVGAIGAVHNVTASGSYTVLGTDLYVCINKATPAPTAVLLPSAFNQSSLLNIKDCSGNAATYPITLTPASGTIDGNTTVVMSVNYEAITLSYNGSGWSIW
jgi:hypothetical protein